MAKVIQKFSDLINQKREKLALEYEQQIIKKYPILTSDKSLYKQLESQFSKDNVEKKMEYYDLDCVYQLTQFIMKKEVYLPFFDLLIVLKDLKWLENLTNEFHLSLEEQISLLKIFFKQIIAFYIPQNVRTYNMAIAARNEAEQKYASGTSYENLLPETILWTQNPNMQIAKPDFLQKQKACGEIRELVQKDGIEVIFSFSETLRLFGLSDKLINSLSDYYSKKKKKIYSFPSPVQNTPKETSSIDKNLIEKQIEKYMIDETFNGIIEGQELKKFLELAKKLYSSTRVGYLKEKILLNNKKLKEEKRLDLLSKIMNEENREYYNVLCSIDKADITILPYLSYIQDVISRIEGYINDLTYEEDPELTLLYSEDIQDMLTNMKSCLSHVNQKR